MHVSAAFYGLFIVLPLSGIAAAIFLAVRLNSRR